MSRVVIDYQYNRAGAPPLWNCPDCFERKDRERRAVAHQGTEASQTPDAA